MMIEICNLREKQPNKPFDVRVDRKSVLGNPYYMVDESKRDEVCEKYEYWFRCQIHNKKAVSVNNEMDRLIALYKKYGKLRLYCWCAPKRCHVETIRSYILSLLPKGKV